LGRKFESKRSLTNQGITQEQYEAGQEWARIVHRHAAIMGYSLRVKSPNLHFSSPGEGGGRELEDDEIAKIRRAYRNAYNALARAAQDHGHVVQIVTWSVCVDNIPISDLTPQRVSKLRIGLNSLANKPRT